MKKVVEDVVDVFKRVQRYDPSKTAGLRNAFVREFRKRFRRLTSLIVKAIVDKDCFGLMELRTHSYEPTYRQFAFRTTEEKIEAFMLWLEKQIQDELLSMIVIPQIGESRYKRWTDMYIYAAYKRGVERARKEMRGIGFSIPTAIEEIDLALMQPVHLERLGLLYTRTFEDLKGITSQMATQISRVLTQGLAEGDNPRVLARKLVATINGGGGELGITDILGRYVPAKRRAEMLARTEVLRAHHMGMIQEMRNWGVVGVKVKAEWRTAGYNVCPICAELEGKVFTLDKAEKLIPRHPNCRCCVIPVREKPE